MVGLTAFLRGDGIELRPVSPGERDRLAARPWLSRAGSEDILLAVARPGAPPIGLVALCGIDWVGRDARVAAWWAAHAPARPALEADVLRLVVGYVRDELNLDALDAEPGDDLAQEALAATGFDDGRWRRA